MFVRSFAPEKWPVGESAKSFAIEKLYVGESGKPFVPEKWLGGVL